MIENQAISTIMSRTSVRRYTDEMPSEEEIKTILEAAMSAPSAMSYYPWHFVVIKDEAVKDSLREALPYAKMINKGCVGIVVCGDESLYEAVSKREGEDNTLYWVEDCSAATENMLLAAHAIGLGAVWTGIFPLESRIKLLKKLLQLPEKITPLNLVLVGKPLGNLPKAKNKFDESKIHNDKF